MDHRSPLLFQAVSNKFDCVSLSPSGQRKGGIFSFRERSRRFASTRLSLPSLPVTCGVPPPLSVRSFIKPSRNFPRHRLLSSVWFSTGSYLETRATYVYFYQYKLTLAWFNLPFTFFVLRISKRRGVSWTDEKTHGSIPLWFWWERILHFLKVPLGPYKKYVSRIFV